MNRYERVAIIAGSVFHLFTVLYLFRFGSHSHYIIIMSEIFKGKVVRTEITSFHSTYQLIQDIITSSC